MKVEDLEARDHITLKALVALMPIYWEDFDSYTDGKELVKCQVESAYEYADEMLRQRNKS